MSTQRIYRSLDLTAHLGWARLLIGRYRDLIEVPALTRQSSDGHHDLTPGDEDTSNPDTQNN